MMRNSVGNITEILELLDKENYSGTELRDNYAYLVEKWGEWETDAGTGGFTIRYIDIGRALFSGLMIMYSTFTVVSLCIALIFGKMMFPLLAKYFKNNNEEMVDMATLKSASQIDAISKSKEWF